jgi:hypothetical protein
LDIALRSCAAIRKYLLHIGSSELGFPACPEAGSPGFDLLKLPFREFEIDERMLAIRKME